jgi:hypothetical protein
MAIAYKLKQKKQRQALLAEPLPTECIALLQQRLPIYKHLPASLKDNLHQLMVEFLLDKNFVGCDGLEITDEIRWLTASQACLLILNRKSSCYQSLRWIYIYPSAFYVKRDSVDPAGVVSKQTNTLLGESWNNGKVILSWNDVTKGISNFEDGHNVALHEFAHQLDAESGSTNGAPLLPHSKDYLSWSRILTEEFNELRQQSQHGIKSIIDSYGATNPAEFFAVATEVFFEKPTKLAQTHPELFAELQNYYQVDPRQWQ